MDITPEFSGTASGFMNFGFGLAGMISPVVFGAIIDATGRWDYPFVASLGFLLVGAVLALFIRPDIKFLTPLRPAMPGTSPSVTGIVGR
jgi:MFS family permease